MATLAGKLNTRVTLSQKQTTQDSIGQPVQTWVTVGEVWANVAYGTGLGAGVGQVDAEEVQGTIGKCSIRMRQSSCISAVMAGWRVQYTQRGVQHTLDVLEVRPQGMQFFDLVCKHL